MYLRKKLNFLLRPSIPKIVSPWIFVVLKIDFIIIIRYNI
jgi:hypothetical protein